MEQKRALDPDYFPKSYVPSSEEVPPALVDNLVATPKTKESRVEEDKTEEGQTKEDETGLTQDMNRGQELIDYDIDSYYLDLDSDHFLILELQNFYEQ